MTYTDIIRGEIPRPSPPTEVEVRFLGNINDRTVWSVFWDLCACGDGMNREVLASILTRLSYMEGSRTHRNKRRELEKTLDCISDLKEALTSSTPTNPHFRTIQELAASAEWIADDLVGWNKGRAKRGVDPKTPVLVALMAYVRHATHDAHYTELSELVSAAYGISGSSRDCSEESLKMLWERNPRFRKNWQATLGLSPRPTSRQKTHAPSKRRPLGIVPQGGFKPPEEHKSAVLGVKRLPERTSNK
jgi:hypothetical protein